MIGVSYVAPTLHSLRYRDQGDSLMDGDELSLTKYRLVINRFFAAE